MSIRNNLDGLLQKFERGYATHNRIEVSASAILHNVDLFRQLTGKHVIPVLKGNAYGHGIEQVAWALSKHPIPYLAVDGYFEALRVRKVSKQPVLIMGAIKPENFKNLRYDNFAFVVSDEATINALARSGKRVNVHLECNTGMNRYGVEPEELTKLTQLILRHRNLTLEGVMSHLADSDGNDPSTIGRAVALFDRCVESILAAGAKPSLIHVAQTAGSVRVNSKYANTIRLGIGLYGINPFPPSHRLHMLLANTRPVMKFVSTITKVIQLEKGDQVSYNYTFTAPRQMMIGVLPVGYYEGVPRELSNKGVVKIGKEFTPIVGRICMNHTMISLENIAANVGDEVVVFSNNPNDENSIDKTAAKYKLFNYSMLTCLGKDTRRILVE